MGGNIVTKPYRFSFGLVNTSDLQVSIAIATWVTDIKHSYYYNHYTDVKLILMRNYAILQLKYLAFIMEFFIFFFII